MSDRPCETCAHCVRDFWGRRCLNERVLVHFQEVQRVPATDARAKVCGDHGAYYEYCVKVVPIPTKRSL